MSLQCRIANVLSILNTFVQKQRLAEPSADNSLPSSISSMSPGIIHQYLLKQQSKVLKDLTEIELDDWRIPEDCIINTTAWVSPRTLDQLPEFISKSK
jgi:hypothetical protein